MKKDIKHTYSKYPKVFEYWITSKSNKDCTVKDAKKINIEIISETLYFDIIFKNKCGLLHSKI